MAVAGGNEVVNTHTPLWRKFDDMVQDDASHFLQELVNISV